jgi:hypothetical protein
MGSNVAGSISGVFGWFITSVCGNGPIKALWEIRVEFIQDGETLFRGAFRSKGAGAGFGIELDDADGGEFLDQLVDADFAMLGKLAEAGVFVVGEADGRAFISCGRVKVSDLERMNFR